MDINLDFIRPSNKLEDMRPKELLEYAISCNEAITQLQEALAMVESGNDPEAELKTARLEALNEANNRKYSDGDLENLAESVVGIVMDKKTRPLHKLSKILSEFQI